MTFAETRPTASRRLAIWQRRHARRLAQWNAAIWALGNGLVTSTLIIYLAIELGATRTGLAVGLIRATPQLIGVLRLAAPALVGRLAGRKPFCIGAYLLSGLVLLALPWGAAPGRLASADASMALLVILWGTYHLLEHLGTVALWSWLADLVPERIRGRFLGRRDRWLLTGQIVGMAASGLFTYAWTQHYRGEPHRAWIGYAISAAVGAGVLMMAVVPLAGVPAIVAGRAPTLRSALLQIIIPLKDRRFLRLVAFGAWLAVANSLSVPAQDIYVRRVLEIHLLAILGLQTFLRGGQWGVSPWLGRLADRLGNRPVMAGSLLIVATGPLFYALATPQQPWWIGGAWVVWIAFAGLNVCLPNLLLKLSPVRNNIPYIAVYYAISGLAFAGGNTLSGALADFWGSRRLMLVPGMAPLDYYHAAFLLGWVARSLGLIVLWWVVESRSGESMVDGKK